MAKDVYVTDENVVVGLSAPSPFGNTIALKDIKDKNTSKKESMGKLFDCVQDINSASENLKSFVEASPDSVNIQVAQKFLESLAQMQVEVLEMCKDKIQDRDVDIQQSVGLGENLGMEIGGEDFEGTE